MAVTWESLGRIALWVLAIGAIPVGGLFYFGGMMGSDERLGRKGLAIAGLGLAGCVALVLA